MACKNRRFYADHVARKGLAKGGINIASNALNPHSCVEINRQ